MKRTPWWIAAAFAASMGCSSTENPNEKDFPGAKGSTVPAPKAGEKGSGGMSSGDGKNLPSNYPAPVLVKKGAPKGAPKDVPSADPAKTAEESKTPPPKPEAKDVPKAETKDAPKAAEPPATKDVPQPAPPK
jgi:hypothetical protein